ncbi:2,3-diaminopropionate biosynthesis protein SbnB [Rhodococcus sp. B7740]|uniref:2,3-diaminopropionate biosynthesis protein SbnB n=1 Tax=Rhodococcus sp. B7740 TaxID=1564114 RepID=UPI000A700B80|nr:2,3-diaminopropionate biosynthesis protein SbnB [Rhodococcus sp. B7740]
MTHTFSVPSVHTAPSIHTAPSMSVITKAEVDRVVSEDRPGVLDTIAATYRAVAAGDVVVPHSSFLRFPDRPSDRIIALPAFLGSSSPAAGIKWISSWPGNTAEGRPRASAVLILNDMQTGFPYAMLESSTISANRTAAGAVLAAERVVGERRAAKVAIIGAGLISRTCWSILTDLGWSIDELSVFDTDLGSARRFRSEIDDPDLIVTVADSAVDACRDADLVIIATVAAQPHLHDPALLDSNPVVLHLSLRDLAPELIAASVNITDDVDHAIRERTSLHLAELAYGHRDFVRGTLGELLDDPVTFDRSAPIVFSPFGLGVLDIALGRWVHDRVTANGGGHTVSDFFG